MIVVVVVVAFFFAVTGIIATVIAFVVDSCSCFCC